MKRLNNWHVLLIAACIYCLSTLSLNAQTTIPTDYYGMNAWMPDSTGTKKYYGKLEQKWKEIGDSKPKIIRIGGIASDRYPFTDSQLLNLIDSIQLIGAEPIVQVPVWGGIQTAANAARLVELVNITQGKNVKYWSIGNEPNHVYDNVDYDLGGNVYGRAEYAASVRAFSIAMKTVDPNIKTIAGELAWYYDVWINELIKPGGADDISGNNGTHDYIDYFSFHRYPFNRYSNPQTRATAINALVAFETVTNDLNTRIATANATHSRSNPLQYGLSEVNINTVNQDNNDSDGVGSNSFLAGQWWADIMMTGIQQGAQFMTFWSAIEGSDGSLTDNGYISHTTGKLKPIYHHFQLCAQNMSGTLYPVTENGDSVKVYAAKNAADEWHLLILNYNENTNFDTRIRLDNATITGSEVLKINVDGGVAKEIIFTVAANSTHLLELNSCGVLINQLVYSQTNANNDEPPEIVITPRTKKVFAHYLPWYDTNDPNRVGWCYEGDCTDENIVHYSNKPRIGEYSQYEADVLEYHILTAHVAGIDGFIINLNPQWGLQKNLLIEVLKEINLLKAKYAVLNDFKVIISYDNSSTDATTINNYFTYIHDNIYQHADYKDLIFVDEITGEQVLQAWSESDNQAYYTVAKNIWACKNVQLMIRNAREYNYSDGNFGWVNYLSNDPMETASWGEEYFNDFDWGMANQEVSGLTNRLHTNQIMMGMAYPGFNDENVPSFWNGGTSRYIQRDVDAGETMSLTWDMQINWTSKRLGGTNHVQNPYTQIITWNDWPEGTSIEPATDDTYGYRPLKTNRTKIAAWKNTPSIFAEPCLEVPYHLYLVRQAGEDAIANAASDLLMAGDCTGASELLNSVVNPNDGTCLTDITIINNANNSYCATDTISSSSIINNSENITYKAAKSILMTTGFEVKVGADFLAMIEDCCMMGGVIEVDLPLFAKTNNSTEETVEQRPTMQVIPNPFDASLTIKYEVPKEEFATLVLLNNVGQLQSVQKISGNGLNDLTLNTNDLPTGIYFIQLRQGNRLIATEKLVKVRN